MRQFSTAVNFRFELGTLSNATRYINQFTEIFTEEGRKNVKITHKVPNQPPRVSFTPGLRASMTQQAAAATTNSAPTAILQKKPTVQVRPRLQFVFVRDTDGIDRGCAVLQLRLVLMP